MTNNKEKYAFWLTPEAKKMIEINAPLANCGSQSEFVEKAVRFYDGYLQVQTAGAFLPHAVTDVLEGTLGVFANRMAKMLFNLTVEHNITNHLLAADVDMTREEYNKLRGGSVREVTSTRGTISLRDVISDSQEWRLEVHHVFIRRRLLEKCDRHSRRPICDSQSLQR